MSLHDNCRSANYFALKTDFPIEQLNNLDENDKNCLEVSLEEVMLSIVSVHSIEYRNIRKYSDDIIQEDEDLVVSTNEDGYEMIELTNQDQESIEEIEVKIIKLYMIIRLLLNLEIQCSRPESIERLKMCSNVIANHQYTSENEMMLHLVVLMEDKLDFITKLDNDRRLIGQQSDISLDVLEDMI
jgi:hypothetical protein